MTTDFTQIGLRIRGLREACDVTPEEIAAELGVPAPTYIAWENTGADIPISAVSHIANRFGVDMVELLTGDYARLDTFAVVKAGQGLTVERYPGYHFEDLAFRFRDKVMQPFLVTLQPGEVSAPLVKHPGQEFNLVLEGTVILTFDDHELTLETGDSVYFSPSHLHGQRCGGDVPATFVTVIAE
jgi:mannose-6-phosphate isomerase-like protein (cupin superfamily)/DNA-binding XRE family transcriptional regulator